MASHGSIEELLATLRRLEDQLLKAQAEAVPSGEPALAIGSRFRRALKRRQFRLTRPVSRRYDRIAAELAGLAAQVAERVTEIGAEVAILRHELAKRELPPGGADAGGVAVLREAPTADTDLYYWAFEERMRGSAETIEARLRGYEGLAVGLLDELGREPAPLWLDLGCGKGEFLAILRGWGWRVHGVDVSPGAVEACRARGFTASQGDATECLDALDGEAPAAISAIQVIEHLPKDRWLGFFHAARRALRPGGALLVETINPMSRGLADSFFADVSHTWPAHPETLRLMAEHAGFDRVEVRFVNSDQTGAALDFAIWAVTAAG
ncbi:MAG: methyltransferase domain-containing protein [Actinobacteria bacterium]|nr:methyltransferase domain-containing protein [Actinomycetota bacterium]